MKGRENKIETCESVHLGELVGCTAGDFSNPEEGELGLEVLELSEELLLCLAAKLVHLDPRCTMRPNQITQNVSGRMQRKRRRDGTKVLIPLTHWCCRIGRRLLEERGAAARQTEERNDEG
jgi:hypothetical protein